MMAPQPPQHPAPADADRPPEVRLDVRVGTARAVGYDLTRGEFLVGGADGCDVKLPGSHLPPVIAQFGRTPDAVFVRRLSPAFPILLNGTPLSGSDPVRLNSSDRLAIGSADIVVTVNGKGHLRPKFHEVQSQPKPAPAPAPNFDRERAALDAYREQLEQQAKELEADRVAWYRRRQEIDAEVRRLQESVTNGTRLADREAWLTKREQEVAAREEENAKVRAELADIRQTLFEQYRERREQIEQMQQVVRGATDTFQERQSNERAELDRRRAELDAEAGRLQGYVTAEVERRVGEAEMEFRRRRMELEVQHEGRLRELEAEAASRRARFEDELRNFEPRMADLLAQREQVDTAFRELDEQRRQLAAMRQELAGERLGIDAERRWNDERRAEAEALHASQEAELQRQRDLLDHDRQELEGERQRLAGDLLRLDRWQAAVEERQLQLDHRAAEIDERVKQLTRDAMELEEHVVRTEAEQERLAREDERLAGVRRETEQRAAQLSERSAQLEAQQATLAVLRVRLDRHEDDLHREAAALTADRLRIDAAQRELDDRLRDAEHLRASLGEFHTSNAEAERVLAEQRQWIELTQLELRQQREQLAGEQERLNQREHDLDRRSADIAEQTAVLKAKTAQVIDLQQRLEADRAAVQNRESTLSDADTARVTFQEQLRKRGEELTARAKELDTAALKLTDDKLAVERLKAELASEREKAEQAVVAARQQLHDREAELARQGQLLAEREAALERQVNRLRETGRSVAAGRKELFTSRQKWQIEQATLVDRTIAAQKELERFRTDALAEVERLKTQAPTLEDQAGGTLQKLTSAREVLRGQLAELHAYANQTRDTLESLRNDLRVETERLRYRETELERARGEHRLAVSEFRAQVLDWQTKVNGLKEAMTRSETRIDQKQAELEAAAKKSDDTALELARRMEQLRLDQDSLAERRVQVERHLGDMREWYRKKLRDLAAEKQAEPSPLPRIAPTDPDADIEPGDRHLGELLRSLELIDPATLDTLWGEARRQRRTLRQVLLASGAITLYQLALIEAGNLDSLMIGRFRVVDRVRVTPREAVYRVFDPAAGGLRILRVLGDAEMHDATHPDEYRQRFATAAALVHPNLTLTHEVLEVNGRPAAVQEVVSGVPGSEWPAACATPGVWVKLAADAAAAMDAAHRAGLTHGRITTDTFILTANGELKATGFGDPPWLTSGMPPAFEPTTGADLRALGQAIYLWSQAGGKKRVKGKGFPEPLLAVVRRLETDPENPMGDTAAGVDPYRSAAELHADLMKLAAKYPLGADAWDEMLRAAGGGGDVTAKKAG
jgi:DNA repair exonuclease SbcCD ATPase subunit